MREWIAGVEVAWLGRVPYLDALTRQRVRRDRVIDGSAPEAFWLLEHDPVITTGRRGVDDLPDADTLRRRGLQIVHTERGGLATWHGPGQLVGYLVLDLARHGLKVRTMVHGLEQGIIDWLAARDVPAARRDGYPGVWVGRDKVCAVGLHFRHGVSLHGFALNLVNDLDGFQWITPCGITDGGVTTLARRVPDAPRPEDAAPSVARAVLHALGIPSH